MSLLFKVGYALFIIGAVLDLVSIFTNDPSRMTTVHLIAGGAAIMAIAAWHRYDREEKDE
jgi:hypothetical protein